MKNKETGEIIYWLYINCMNMSEVCINKRFNHSFSRIPVYGFWVQGK